MSWPISSKRDTLPLTAIGLPSRGSGSTTTLLSWSRTSKGKSPTLLDVIREIDIWRVAVLMINRYADDAEANADQRADELETGGDHAGSAIWRRVIVAIEQLTDTTGPLH
jgi:hypothetical protein